MHHEHDMHNEAMRERLEAQLEAQAAEQAKWMHRLEEHQERLIGLGSGSG